MKIGIGISPSSTSLIRTIQKAAGGGGAAPSNPDFISTWDTTKAGSSSDTVVLPLVSGGTYSGTIDWGDGNSDSLSYANQTHVYASSGIYTITLSGTIEGFSFNNSGDKLKIHDVSNWGTLVITNGQSVFQNCSNLTVSATDAPTLNTTTLKWFMYNCDALTTEDFSAWDTSNVTIMESTFQNSLLFNANLSGWGHSGVTTYKTMLSTCPAFNNNSLNTWDVSGATTMYEFAKGNTLFNGSVSGWEFTTSCTLYAAFQNCSAFTGIGMDTWVTTAVTSINRICSQATLFNGDTSGWSTANITDVDYAFNNNDAYDQDMSGWTVTQMTVMANFMSGADGMSTANYDALLIAWDSHVAMAFSGTVNFGSSKYTGGGAAAAAHASLVTKWGGITDGGTA